MQEMNEKTSFSAKKLLEDYVTFETKTLRDSQAQLDALLAVFDRIQPSHDSTLFVQYHRQTWTEPYDFAFEPSLLWKDSVIRVL
jgi:hypothetical protein